MIKKIFKIIFSVKNGIGNTNGGRLTKTIMVKYKKNLNFSDIKKVFVFSKAPIAGGGTFINSLLKIRDKKIDLRFFSYEQVSNPSAISNKLSYLNKTSPSSQKLNLSKFLLFLKNLITTYILLKKEKPVIIITLNIYSFIIIHIINIFSKTKFAIVFRVGDNVFQYVTSKPGLIYQKILLLLTSYFIRRTKYFIFVAQDIFLNFKRKFEIKNPIKYFIIHHGINLDLAKKLGNKQILKKESVFFNTNNIKIISIGRFEEQKDFFTIIKAFKIVKEKFTPIKLILVGAGSCENQLKNLSEILGCRDSVHFFGWKQNVFPYLKNSNLFIYSSNYEGFGYVILEAMSQSLPIVATNTPHTPSEILENGKYGILVPVGNYKKMAEEIIKFLKSKKLREKYSRLAYQRVKYFSEEKMLKKYKEFLSDLILNNKELIKRN